MRFANSHTSRRGAFLLIALFSCLNIICGFILITQGSRAESPIAFSKPASLSLTPQIILSAKEQK